MYLKEIEYEIMTNVKALSEEKKLDNKKIFLFGCNMFITRINNYLYNEGHNLCGIIDNDKNKQGKRIHNISVIAPEDIMFDRENILILIASRHKKSMIEQIRCLYGDVEIAVLADMTKYMERARKSNEFWIGDNCQAEIRELYQGSAIYDRLKQEEKLLIMPVSFSLGDSFLGGGFFDEYKKKVFPKCFKIVAVADSCACKIMQLYGIERMETISKEEMDALLKFVFFYQIENDDVVVCDCVWTFFSMAMYKKISFPKCFAKFIFKLDNEYKIVFPSIWDKKLEQSTLEADGLIKGKSVILAPYANSIEELPVQFWELLVKKLKGMEYHVFTNIAGNQSPIKGSNGIRIPLEQIGNYLEYAGYFIALRSGLCDVAGRSQCKQIIIFRDQKVSCHSSYIELYDLHADGVSKNAIQCLYEDERFFDNIDMVIQAMSDTV